MTQQKQVMQGLIKSLVFVVEPGSSGKYNCCNVLPP